MPPIVIKGACGSMRSGRGGQFRQPREAPLGPLEEMFRTRVIGLLLSRDRENEVVNLFAHRFLTERASASGPLRSLRQVGIEVAVPQVVGDGKRYVRKDLVIWPEEDMTAFMGDGIPAVIMEWKRDDPGQCDGDVEWLRVFCGRYPGTVGYSACVMLAGVRGCVFTRVGA